MGHDTPEWYQLHLGPERIKIPEILFQPSILGHEQAEWPDSVKKFQSFFNIWSLCEQAGISESIEFILGKIQDEKVRESLVKNTFVTGALARLPGIKVSWTFHKAQDLLLIWKFGHQISYAYSPSSYGQIFDQILGLSFITAGSS